MTEFEGQIWTAQEEDEATLICISKRAKHKIQALNEKNRDIKLSEDKLLWQHNQHARHLQDWPLKLAELQTIVQTLHEKIDISLLWESALELNVSEMDDLADLYFGGEITPEHLLALWKALAKDRTHFKRRGKTWEPRTVEQVQELKNQRKKEHAKAQEYTLTTEWWQKLPLPSLVEDQDNSPQWPIKEEIVPFIQRLEAWLLRGDTDKWLEELLTRSATSLKITPRELAFEVLLKLGRLPPDTDRDLVIAGLKPEFSTPVLDAAQLIPPWLPAETQSITELLFSIDDEETREVDDALAIERQELLWCLTIAIADPASLIHRGDPLDKEAMRRGTTVYLPTQTVLMLPESISCERVSLSAQQIRPSIVIRAWVNDHGDLIRSQISREAIRVAQRIHYSQADELIAQGHDSTAQALQDLYRCAQQLQSRRAAAGAFNLQRPEFKITVQQGQTKLTLINKDSQSRLLVAEMMILGNYIAAHYAQIHQVPIIYRIQDPPLEPITPELITDPLGFQKIRKLLRASSLSLQPSNHSGLGLTVYTQLTSPLRRFADLVIQRQLLAHLLGQPCPYNQEELFKVLATVERTAREARAIENESKKRWFAHHLKYQWATANQPLEVIPIEPVKSGYRVEIQPWCVEALLIAPQSNPGAQNNQGIQVGKTTLAVIDKIRIKTSYIRLKVLSP